MGIKFSHNQKKQIISFLKLVFKLPKSDKLFSAVREINRKTELFDNQYRIYEFKNRLIFNLKLQDWIQLQLFFLNKYEDFELTYVRDILTKGDHCIDIGANFGLYTLWCASIVGKEGRVISFEPFKKNFEALEQNIKLNNFENVTAVESAVSDVTSQLDLFYDERDKNLGMVSSHTSTKGVATVVEAVSVDDYVETNKISSIKFIKIDIEGGEYLALKGMVKTIDRFKPILQVEIDDSILVNTPFRSSDIFGFFEEMDYEVFTPVLEKSKTLSKAAYSKNYYFRYRL